MTSCLTKRALVALVGFLCLNPNGSAHGQHVKIAVITSDTLTSSRQSLEGIRDIVQQEYPDVEFELYSMDIDSAHNREIIDSIRSLNPALALTIGSPATELARANFDDLPIVFSAVKYPALSGFVESEERPGRNITGASLDIPIETQFECFKKVIPSLKRIGVLYTDNTAGLIEPAKVVASRLNLELIAIRVDDERELPHDLDSLTLLVDGLWSVADYKLFGPQSTRYILLSAVRKGIPLMGFSQHIVESGALFALDFDYRAVGTQAGKIVNMILGGGRPSNIAVSSADVIYFHYNENTARRLKVHIPDELASVARRVH